MPDGEAVLPYELDGETHTFDLRDLTLRQMNDLLVDCAIGVSKFSGGVISPRRVLQSAIDTAPPE